MQYKLIRSRRKTLTICIEGGEVIVKAPLRTDMAHIEGFVSQKAGWIEKKLALHRAHTADIQPVIDGEYALYHGNMCKIAVSEAHKRIAVADGMLYLPQKYAATADSKARAISAWYRRVAAKELEERLAALAAFSTLRYKSFALTNARTKWGSCDSECNIRLNWRLVMLDAALIDYVIIHELSHTEHHDHSAAFWARVGAFYPDYKAARKKLKAYSTLTALYR